MGLTLQGCLSLCTVHQYTHTPLSRMHLGVKGLRSINHSFGHHLSSPPLRGAMFCGLFFPVIIYFFWKNKPPLFGAPTSCTGREGWGILSQGLWGKLHSWFLSTPRTVVSQRYHKQRKVMQPCVMGAGPTSMPRFWISWLSKALWTTEIIHCTRYQMPNTDF